MLRVSIPIAYIRIPDERRSMWLSGLKREVLGIGFVGIVVQNLSVYGMEPIPILYHNALLKVVLVEGKIALPCGAS